MLKLVFQSIFLPFLSSPVVVFFKNNIFNWFSVITQFVLLTLLFTCCYMLGVSWRLNISKSFHSVGCVLLILQGSMKKLKQGNERERYCLPFHPFKCVMSKQYDLGRTSSLNCWKNKSLPLAKYQHMPQPLPM